MRFITVLSGLLLAATVYSQSIVTPVFVHKDGDASASGYTGSEKELYVDGGSQQTSGWIVFQTGGVDFSKIAAANLTLFVKQVQSPGTLGIYPLTAAITAPENNVPLASIPTGATAAATISLGTADAEKIAQVDITALIKGGSFHGVALVSDDGLRTSFDAKEGRLAPMILLMHDIESEAAKWHSGAIAPAEGIGKDGDYYLNTASGDVSAKSGGAWSMVTNIVGPTGATGAAGTQGPKGDKGDQGDTGPQGPIGLTGAAGAAGHSPATTSRSTLAIASTGSVDLILAGNRNAFAEGQRLRLASNAGLTNWMEGNVSVYDATTGTATVALDNSAGKGTFSSWTVTVAGTFPLGTAVGDMQYWDGIGWKMIPAGRTGQSLNLVSTGIPQWSDRPGTMTDINGNSYRTVVIGNQEWTATNIRTTHYRDGTPIPLVNGTNEWAAPSTSGKYCIYPELTNNVETYGFLYTWYAVNDPRGFAPEGWRVPADADWIELENYLITNGFNYDGTTSGNKVAKSMAAGEWTASTAVGTIGMHPFINNKSGFSALPGGLRTYTGGFSSQGVIAFFWSATEYNSTGASYRSLLYLDSTLTRDITDKRNGYSVRLVRDVD